MSARSSLRRTVRRARSAPERYFRNRQVRRYRRLSTNQGAFNGSTVVTPVLAIGPGRIEATGAQLGYVPSPFAYDRCIHLEARGSGSIRIGEHAVLNNACVLISEGPGITVGPDTLFGPEVMVFDSDFHGLHPDQRHETPARARVLIGRNVFIGARSTVLKGVEIGDNSVVGAGSVVSSDVPPNVIAAGNPCVVIRTLEAAPEEATSTGRQP
jgi:maltose O-acetyltransferase